MNTTLRNVRPAKQSASTNEFHKVRLQEYQRETALAHQGASEEQVGASHFIPTLQSLCVQLLASNFERTPEIDELREDAPELYERIVNNLPVGGDEVSLPTAVTRISSEAYWKRCCEARWSEGQLNKYTGETVRDKTFGWKRLYLEHLLADFLLSLGPNQQNSEDVKKGDWTHKIPCFAPSTSATGVRATSPPVYISDADQRKVSELCAIGRDYIHTIFLPQQVVHFHLYQHLFSKIPGILHFLLTYTSVNGQSTGFQEDDVAALSEVLTRYTGLQVLRLPNNRLNFNHVYRIVQAAVVTNSLQILDLSRNALDDQSLQALAYLLVQPQTALVELNLEDNSCGSEGTKSLVQALQVNKTLRVLQLQQNRLCDFPPESGIPALVTAAAAHPGLTELHLSYNSLGLVTLEALPAALLQSATLTTITLTGNPLVPEGAVGQHTEAEERLLKSITEQNNILQFDCDFCNLSERTVQGIRAVMQERARARHAAGVAVQEGARRAEIERNVTTKINAMYSQ